MKTLYKTLFSFVLLNFFTVEALPQSSGCSPSELTSAWVNLGPFDDEQSHIARVTALYVNPVNPDEITIGTRGSGLWQTHNGGLEWQNLFSYDLPPIGINEIVNASVFVAGPDYTTNAFMVSVISVPF